MSTRRSQGHISICTIIFHQKGSYFMKKDDQLHLQAYYTIHHLQTKPNRLPDD
ncbi:hypothetical protein PAHAL_6G282300 [Panicum hallii]|uniref:Uncharacterized protein n=1 Tax=Panicum hallii TaxID=206008 RepID=A0A2T8IHZ9_9POAL|nr:hypothetical protein PAHAL_6G282300 [Panicum hallii]